jgi:hypothetical protein
LKSVEAEDFGQFLKQARQTTRLQQVQQKAWAFLDDRTQRPTEVVARSAQHRLRRITM